MRCAAAEKTMATDPHPLLDACDALRPVDRHLGLLLARQARHDPEAIALLAALVCQALGQGHLCLDLQDLERSGAKLAEGIDAGRLVDALRAETEICQEPDFAGEPRPLVLDDRKLYLHRYWLAEQRVATRLLQLAQRPLGWHAEAPHWLGELYPRDDAGSRGQKLACAIALSRGLGVISGGPGTGKTTTVARLLVLLARDAQARGERLRVALAAPTGKAATRIVESLEREFGQLGEQGLLDPALRALLPERAMTLHRLLGARAGRGFRHDQLNPLATDVVVVDESSMVDLRLLDALLDALPRAARLLLLGDRDQLAAVEPGNVFGALCAGAGRYSPTRSAELHALCAVETDSDALAAPIADATAVLRHSYRFDAASGIGRLAVAVNAGDASGVEAALAAAGDVRSMTYRQRLGTSEIGALRDAYRELASAAIAAAGNPEAMARLPAMQDRFRVLCALREGDTGVTNLNQLLSKALADIGLADRNRDHYPGRLLLVTRNDHGLQLYNGDLGIVVDDEDGRPQAVFALAGGVRRLPVARLPQHESAYALTVHKSQGSEFDRVALVLPPATAATGLAGRELLYTAITRARNSVDLLLPDGQLDACWLERSRPRSGLAGRIG